MSRTPLINNKEWIIQTLDKVELEPHMVPYHQVKKLVDLGFVEARRIPHKTVVKIGKGKGKPKEIVETLTRGRPAHEYGLSNNGKAILDFYKKVG